MLRALLSFAVLPAALCLAQPAAPFLPTFEVAAIKPSSAAGNHSSSHSNNGRINMENLTLKQIILNAYGIQNHQYSGPAWLENERYNVDAKADTKVEYKELMAMLQALLAERCKLVVHHESKSVSGYALVVSKGGLKVKPVEGEGSGMNTDNTKLTATHVDMPRLARYLAGVVNLPVVDETGVKDSFSFEMEFADPRPGREDRADAASLPTIFTALTEKLGLKLETRKVPIDVVVVDHVEKPTEN
jgi:uncharacterized protein (TIGR03435 family)